MVSNVVVLDGAKCNFEVQRFGQVCHLGIVVGRDLSVDKAGQEFASDAASRTDNVCCVVGGRVGAPSRKVAVNDLV